MKVGIWTGQVELRPLVIATATATVTTYYRYNHDNETLRQTGQQRHGVEIPPSRARRRDGRDEKRDSTETPVALSQLRDETRQDKTTLTKALGTKEQTNMHLNEAKEARYPDTLGT